MTNLDPVKVIIIDDNRFQRSGLKSSLEAEPDIQVVGDYSSAEEAAVSIDLLAPQVALLSARLPEITAFEACRQLTAASPSTRVVVLTLKLTNEEIITSMMAGAAAYLPMDASPSDLVRTVRSNARGELLLLPAVAETALRFLRFNRKLVDVHSLTRRERQILALVAQGLSNAEIGTILLASPLTVRNHISRIFTKLDISRRAELVPYAALIGVLDSPDLEDPIQS